MRQESFLHSLVYRLRGSYVFFVALATQLAALPGFLLGVVFIQINSDYSSMQSAAVSGSIIGIFLFVTLILLVITARITAKSRRLIDSQIKNPLQKPTEDELSKAWAEITGFTSRFGTADVVATGIGLVFISGYFYLTSFINFDQLIYLLMGSAAIVITVVILAALIVEQFLAPAREMLTPETLTNLIENKKALPLPFKLVALVAGMIAMMNFILAPIGYHNTVRAISSSLDSATIVRTLQFESIFTSAISLALGFGFAYLAARTVTDPIRNLIRTFGKIERGDLTSRAKVMATDEVGELAIHFNQMVAELEKLRAASENQIQEQLSQMKAAYEVGNVASASLNPTELMDNVAKLIAERLGHYYAAIFLLDETESWIELQAATGDAGKVLKQNKHRLDVKGKSLIAECIAKQKISTLAEAGTSVQIANPLLPYTKSEIAIPLISNKRVLGALNVHSTKEHAFGILETETLQAIASHVAITLENARLYQAVQQNLRELSAIQQQYLMNAWSKLTTDQDIEYAMGDEEAAADNAVEIPLALRDQTLGHIKVQSDHWSAEERNLVEAIAAQAAIAIENARLVNESRQLAYREQLAAEISNKIWTSATIDGVLQVVARDLGRALDADKLVIELAPDDRKFSS